MNIFSLSNVSVLSVTALVSVALVATPTSAFADSSQTDDVLTSSEITASLDIAGGLVQTALPSVTSSQDAAVSNAGDVTVEVPKDLKAGVDLTGTGLDLTIHLPNAADAGVGVKNSDGQVVYSSTSASANTVIPVQGGVQMLTTIANSTAPERYTYLVETAPGDYFQIQEDGSAVLYAADGTVKLGVATPWAKDANGQSIPTHYETDGTSLTQVIEHASAAKVAYPVVSDPFWIPALMVFANLTRHVITQAAARGISQALMKQVVQNGVRTAGNKGTSVFTQGSGVNRIRVIVDNKSGNIITATRG